MFDLIELFAVLSAGLYGVLLARKKGMDLVGVFSVSCIIAFGGGTLRDLFLDRTPLFWIANPHYPVLIFLISVVASIVRFPEEGRVLRLLYVPDALGLGLFSALGAGFALAEGTSLFVASLLGVITGTFGGVLGDIVSNEIPSLFRSGTTLYATCAFLGSWTFLLLHTVGMPEPGPVVAGIAVTVILRLAAVVRDWKLPALR
ncbi:MAG: trimeric intracellular cation channel family protein [Gemmatimonadota bacterium]|nr:trimeric intracellular cation channel family protein [Gemmatimonadota bacterium]